MADRIYSILTADIGSVHTRVHLIDVVDGMYRVIGRYRTQTTIGDPVDNVAEGFFQIIAQIEEETGRRLRDDNQALIMPENKDGDGISAFVVTTSAGRPLRAALVGVLPEISIATAERAISSVYMEPVTHLHIRDGRTTEERLNALLSNRPDVIFIAGGTDGGAQQPLQPLLDVVKLSLIVVQDPALRPVVIFAGNRRLHEKIKEMFDSETELHIAENIRPRIKEEDLQPVGGELDRIYDVYREEHGEGFDLLSSLSQTGILPTAEGYGLFARYFQEQRDENILMIDLGGTSTALAVSLGGMLNEQISSTIGVGQSAMTLLSEVGSQAIERWLPFPAEPSEIQNYALNKSIRPATIPMTLRELYLEQAFIRAGIQHFIHTARQLWPRAAPQGPLPTIGLIVVGGAALNGTGDPRYDLLMIADSVQPSGVTEVQADAYSLLPVLNGIARLVPEAVVQLLDGNGLTTLGHLISLDGQPKAEDTVGKLLFTYNDEPGEIELHGGALYPLPVSLNQIVTIDLRLRGRFRVGGQRRIRLQIEDGPTTILIDTRGRPLPIPEKIQERAGIFPQWVATATGRDPLEIPPEWLAVISAGAFADEAAGSVLDELMSAEEDSPARKSDPDNVIDDPLGDATAESMLDSLMNNTDDDFAWQSQDREDEDDQDALRALLDE